MKGNNMKKTKYLTRAEFNIEIVKQKVLFENHKHNELALKEHTHSNYINKKQLKKIKKQITDIGKGVKIKSLFGIPIFILSLVFMFLGLKGWSIHCAYFLMGLLIFILSLMAFN